MAVDVVLHRPRAKVAVLLFSFPIANNRKTGIEFASNVSGRRKCLITQPFNGKIRNRFLQDRIFALGAHRKGIVGIQRRRVQWGEGGKNTSGGNEDPFHLLYLNHNLIGLIRISNKASSEMDAKRASRVDL
jgi:hypothetical protein